MLPVPFLSLLRTFSTYFLREMWRSFNSSISGIETPSLGKRCNVDWGVSEVECSGSFLLILYCFLNKAFEIFLAAFEFGANFSASLRSPLTNELLCIQRFWERERKGMIFCLYAPNRHVGVTCWGNLKLLKKIYTFTVPPPKGLSFFEGGSVLSSISFRKPSESI